MTDYSAINDFEINKLVALKLGLRIDPQLNCEDGRDYMYVFDGSGWPFFDPCNEVKDAWPIIVKNSISVINSGSTWMAAAKGVGFEGYMGEQDYCCYGDKNSYDDKNPLRAAMVVFLQM